MRIGIDLDNVTYPFVEQLHPIAEHILQRRLLAPIKWDFYTEWGIGGDEFGELLQHAWKQHGLWAVGTPIEGSREVIEWLRDDGHEVIFVTHRPPYAQPETYDWLDHWNLRVYDEEVFFTENKHLVNVDLMLDDAPHVYEQMDGKGVVFNRPWNAKSVGGSMVDARRVHTWEGFYVLVHDLAHVV